SGYKGYEADIWYGVFAPATTPPEVTARLGSWFAAAVQDSGIKAKLAAQGLRPVGTCGDDFPAQGRRPYEVVGRGIPRARLKVEGGGGGARPSCHRRSAAPAPRNPSAPRAPHQPLPRRRRSPRAAASRPRAARQASAGRAPCGTVDRETRGRTA